MDLLQLNWPELGIRVKCRPLESSKRAFESISGSLPVSVVQSHAMVSGSLIYMLNVPLQEPVVYDRPLLRESLADGPVGRVWTTSVNRIGQFQVKYGPVTEDIAYPPLAQIVDEDIALISVVGRAVLESIVRSKAILRVEIGMFHEA